jgi:Fe-S-cluster containining protein
MSNHSTVCSFNCYGQKGYDGSCCQLEERDYIIGPIKDAAEFLNKLSQKIGRTVAFNEVFYDFETGSQLFPERAMFQNPDNYPAFKVDTEKRRLPCVNYNSTLRTCGVYEIRPAVCRNYYCDYLNEYLKHPTNVL